MTEFPAHWRGTIDQLPWPQWVESWHPEQIDAVDEITRALALFEVVILDAPTGAGKTLIAETVRRSVNQKAIYLCSSLTLQDQFLGDFPYANVIKGRSNYPTLDRPGEFKLSPPRQLTAGHCTKMELAIPACDTCRWLPASTAQRDDPDEETEGQRFVHCDYCHPTQHCPYTQAKNFAAASTLAVANITYFLTEANYVGQFGQQFRIGTMETFPRHPLVIVDEADVLEDELMRHIEFSISKRRMLRYGIEPPKRKTAKAADKEDGHLWVEWARDEALPKLEEHLHLLSNDIERHVERNTSPPFDVLKEASELSGFVGKLTNIGESLAENWVYTGYEVTDERYATTTFKPITVDRFAKQTFWRHGDKFLLMSATVISPEQMAEELGLEDHQWTSVTVPSTFDPERRPIYIQPRATMTASSKDESYPKMVAAVQEIVDKYPTDRILIHSHSYELTRTITGNLHPSTQLRVFSYSNAAERALALAQFRKTEGGILVAPSFDRGVDLPNDECRVVIVAKIPFPYLGDKQISARLYGTGLRGQQWYAVQTIRSLVQMTGRGMRHANDQCDIYILDSMFMRSIWKQNRSLLPKWWRDAIKWVP